MKSTSPIKILMIIMCLLGILILSGGCISKDGSPSGNESSSEIDSTCEIQQLNLSIVHNQTIVPVTKEDINPFPEFAISMFDGDNNPPARNSGMRVVKVIDCNASRAIQFLILYRKYEEFPNQPVLEYEGRYYKVGFEEYDSHSTARPTMPVHTPDPVEKMVSIISVSRLPENGMIRISGITSLPADSRVVYEILPADIVTRKKTAEDIDGITGRTFTSGKDGLSVWSTGINMTFWRTGKYIVSAWPGQSDPRYGDTKAFFVPLNDTIVNGAGKESVSGEIILNEILPSEQSSFPVSVTPKPTPETR